MNRQRPAHAILLASLLLAGVLYGAASAHWNWQPYPLLRDAALAAQALRKVYRTDPFNQVAGFVRWERDPELLQRAWNLQAGKQPDEAILVTGGPYRLLERCPTHGCVAWISDRQGRILHQWEADLDQIFANTDESSGRTSPEFFYPWGLHLYPDGSLLVIFQNSHAFPFPYGLYKLDRDGKVIWGRRDLSHHWLDVGPDGRIYVPAIHLLEPPEFLGPTAAKPVCRRREKVHADVIRILSADGRPLQEISINKAFLAAGYAGLLELGRNACDPAHLNSVEVIDADIAAQLTGIDAGDLLLSFRNINAIAVLRPGDGSIRRLITGRTIAQHSPHLLPNGEVLLLDNLGGNRSAGGSQVVAIDLDDGVALPVFPGLDTDPGLLPIYTGIGGHLDLSRDGRRALLSLFDQGRTLEFEIDTGKVLWRHSNVHRMPQPVRDQFGWHGTGQELVRFKAVGAYYVDDVSFLEDEASAHGSPP